MSFDGNGYEEYATSVITSKGDIVRGNASGKRERYGIGSANQVLQVSSGQPVWNTLADSGTDLTTKGDMHGFSSSNTRIPVGSANQSLLADSGQALGLKWGASATSTLTSTGDILSASSANTLSSISPSTSGHVLTSNGATTLPSFQAVSSGTQTFEKLGSVTNTGTSTMTFTPTTPYDQDDYEQFLIVTRGATSHACIVYAEINSSTSNYHQYLQESNGSSVTESWTVATNDFDMSNTSITVGGEAYVSKLWLTLPQDVDEQYLNLQLDPTMRFGDSKIWLQTWGTNSNSIAEINKISINVTANTWISGSTMVVYGVNNT